MITERTLGLVLSRWETIGGYNKRVDEGALVLRNTPVWYIDIGKLATKILKDKRQWGIVSGIASMFVARHDYTLVTHDYKCT